MDLAKCFSCGHTINGAISAVMEYNGVDFIEALEKVASHYGITLTPETKAKQTVKKPRQKAKAEPLSFCSRQLAESGLSHDDVIAETIIGANQDKAILSPFRKGGIDAPGIYNTTHDEMLIYYYDLWGNQVTYASRGAKGSLRPHW